MGSLALYVQEYGHIGVLALVLLVGVSVCILEYLCGLFFNFIDFKFLRTQRVVQGQLSRTDDTKKVFKGGPMYRLVRIPHQEAIKIRIPDFQAVQILRNEGQSTREIAATLGISENEVSSYLQRAKIISEERQLK